MAATLSSRLSAHFAPLHDHPTPDSDLLARYAHHGDAAAFALLVKRHGGMVAAVCRKRLRHAQDAEDATQAVFLALACKAAKVHGTAPVAAWLYGCAARACREVARRNRRKQWQPLTHDVPGDRAMSPDHEAVAAVLDEVGRLSDACQAAVILCELEGVPRSVAARRLGVAEGTLSSRLAAARKTLADRLARRGFAPTAAALLTGLAAGTPAPAFDPPSLTLVVHQITEAIVSTGIAWKLKLLAATCVAGTTLTLGSAAGDGPPPAPAPTPAVAKAAKPEFVFAALKERVERVDPHEIEPAALVVTTLGGDGVAGRSRSTDLTRTSEAILASKDRRGKAVAVGPCECAPTEVGADGRSVAYVLFRTVPPESKLTALLSGGAGLPPRGGRSANCLAFLATPAGRPIQLGGWDDNTPALVWSPDGGMVYSTTFDTMEAFSLTPPFVFRDSTHVTTRIDVATGRQQRVGLPRNARPVAAHPDGKSVLVVRGNESFFGPGVHTLWLATLADDLAEPATLRPLGKPSAAGYGHEAKFSPDGQRAVVSAVELVPYPKDLLPPDSRPKDDQLVPLYPARRFHLVDVPTGTVTPLAARPAAVPDYGRGVQWSPDGTRIAFTDAKGWEHGPAGMQVIEPHVVTCNPDGGNPAKVPMPTPKPVNFQFFGYGPQFVGWR